jgi:hypothetical protein
LKDLFPDSIFLFKAENTGGFKQVLNVSFICQLYLSLNPQTVAVSSNYPGYNIFSSLFCFRVLCLN